MMVSNLRARICTMQKESLGVAILPCRLTLDTLRTKKNKYPTEADAATATGKPTVISNQIGKEFKNTNHEDGWAHLRVRLNAPVQTQPDAEAPAGDATDVDTVTANFKSGCVRSPKKAFGVKRKQDEECIHMSFSKFSEARVKHMCSTLRQTAQDEQSTLEGERSCAPTVHRLCLDALRLHCQQELILQPEYTIAFPELDVAGAADWVVSRGNGMLVVIDAKKKDINKGQYQLLAMMEALLI
ncbi:hypothetical protein PF002_g4890 [Phytophthora fragariae]|uniref:Uncharacterized protein n=1 Tax=Phytophthora fragariae TaxID=53985 RepID=A0A6A4A651_9STRA|nr:hypothetical protein PF002_g4890 [Phytophthora fragariae]